MAPRPSRMTAKTVVDRIFIVSSFSSGRTTRARSAAVLLGARVGAIVDLRQVLEIEMRVDLGGADVRVPEQLLHGAQVAGGFQQVTGEAVPQKVRMHALRQALLAEKVLQNPKRAREIYETILREKRDPGLLEWAGGNVFKARVYPIAVEIRLPGGAA